MTDRDRHAPIPGADDALALSADAIARHADDPLGVAPAVGSPDPLWGNQLCYCSDPRSEHARNLGACLMVRDGVRCGCQRFERPEAEHDNARRTLGASAGADGLCMHGVPLTVHCPSCVTDARDEDAGQWRPPVTLVPQTSGHPGDPTSPAFEWPETDAELVRRLRQSAFGSADREEAETTRDNAALADPVIRHLQTIRELRDIHDMLVDLRSTAEGEGLRNEAALDRLHGEVRDGLGTGLTDPDSPHGARLPATLDDIHESLGRVERNTQGGVGDLIIRMLVAVCGVCLVIAFLFVLAGVTGLLGVLVP